jgi:hypothetical protein
MDGWFVVGILYYGDAVHPIRIGDHALAHLRVIIATKLRRHESFTLSWQHPDHHPEARTTLWLHPSIPLRVVLDAEEPPELDRRWLEELARSASGPAGITLGPEHFDEAPPSGLG